MTIIMHDPQRVDINNNTKSKLSDTKIVAIVREKTENFQV